MKLTEQQLFDYIYCPVMYNIKHVMKINVAEPVSLTKLLNIMSRYFFLNLLNGKVPTFNELKKKWDTLCEQHSDYMTNQKALAGWGKIINFVKWAETEKIIVADVDTNYMVPIGTTQFHGTIDTILIKPNKDIELLTTSFSDKSLDKTEVNMKLKYTMDHMGFKQLYGLEPNGIKIYSVKYGETLFTNRTEPDIIRLKDTIVNVSKSIEQNIYYPRESAFCVSCTSRQYCKYWHN